MNNVDLEELLSIQEKTKKVPLIIISDSVVHPNLFLPLDGIAHDIDISTLKQAYNNEGFFVISTKKDSENPLENVVYRTGTLCQITLLEVDHNNKVTLEYRSLFKYKIANLGVEKNIRYANGLMQTDDVLMEVTDDIWEIHDTVFFALEDYLKFFKPNFYRHFKETYQLTPQNISPFELIGLCFANLNMNVIVKQSILESDDLKSSLKTLLEIISIGTNIKKQLENNQLNAINNNLHNKATDEEQDFLKKLEAKEFPPEVRKIVKREVKRMTSMQQNSSEYHNIENYLNTLYEFPWTERTDSVIDLNKTKEVLENDHFGLEKIKKRILRQLATQKLTNKKHGLIICLDGPPGVGKTSICKSIANSLNREYIRIGLGGVNDEAEIRGHRKTYVGAMPGKMVNALIKSKVKNPLIVLDEIDKIGQSSIKGNVEAALLEVLDPEQNSNFNDHFINTPIDLSDVLFICTSNDISQISTPLRDRMEIIRLGSYTHQEKFHIAKNYLIPKEIKNLGLDSYLISFSDEVIRQLIEDYTREAGVRGLKKVITEVLQHCAEFILIKDKKEIKINSKNLNKFIERKAIPKEDLNKNTKVGVVNGLAWTAVGGDVLLVESIHHSGSGKVSITGQLGDVMKESAQIAMSLVKRICDEKSIKFDFNQKDIHIHFPAGATPKDGPSAGITLLCTLYSLVTNKQVNPFVAMTGEISLTGEVLPVGGIKEKVLAAYKKGIKKVLIPVANEKDLEELPKEVILDNNFKVSLIKNYEEALKELFKNY